MTRIITGSILIAIGVYVLGNGGLPLFLFLSTIGCLAFYEVKKMTELNSSIGMVLNMLVYEGLFFWIYNGQMTMLTQWFFVGLTVILFSALCYEYYQKTLVFRLIPFMNNAKYFLYISLGFSSIYLIRESSNGLFLIALTFLSIWATDVFAYYGGKRFGARQLSEVSPNKTKEGTFIGILSAMILVGLGCGLYEYPLWYALVGGGIGAVAQLGDLYESLVKRTYNVKDSSNILPGHGGILDRADSSLFVAPLMYLMVFFLT